MSSIGGLNININVSIRTGIASLIVGFVVITATTLAFQYTQSHLRNYYLGTRYLKQGQYNEAIVHLNLSNYMRPNNFETVESLVIAYLQKGQTIDALRLLENLSETAGNDIKIWQWLGDIYFGLGEYTNAERYYRSVLVIKKDISVQKKLADVLIARNKYDLAIAILQKLIRQKPDEYEAAELLADVFSWSQNYDKAISIYYNLMSLVPDNDDIILKLADVLRYSGKDEDAVLMYRRYLERQGET